MRTKYLATAAILCSSTLLLTACGGSDSDNDTYNGGGNQSNVDYSKAETSDLITYPVVNLSKEMDNSLIHTANIAEEIHYDVIDPDQEGYTTSCESGTVQKNSNDSVTLTNCKNFKVNNEIMQDVKGLTLSGTIHSKFTQTQTSEKYEITLNNVSIKHIDGEVETYNGTMLQTFTYGDATGKSTAQYDVSRMEATLKDEDTERLILTNYRLTETSTESSATQATANGKLQGDFNGQKYSVTFNSNIKYGWSNFAPSEANINIEDTNNNKNAITIQNTTGGKALISAFANGTSVVGFPKTVDWSYFD